MSEPVQGTAVPASAWVRPSGRFDVEGIDPAFVLVAPGDIVTLEPRYAIFGFTARALADNAGELPPALIWWRSSDTGGCSPPRHDVPAERLAGATLLLVQLASADGTWDYLWALGHRVPGEGPAAPGRPS